MRYRHDLQSFVSFDYRPLFLDTSLSSLDTCGASYIFVTLGTFAHLPFLTLGAHSAPLIKRVEWMRVASFPFHSTARPHPQGKTFSRFARILARGAVFLYTHTDRLGVPSPTSSPTHFRQPRPGSDVLILCSTVTPQSCAPDMQTRKKQKVMELSPVIDTIMFPHFFPSICLPFGPCNLFRVERSNSRRFETGKRWEAS